MAIAQWWDYVLKRYQGKTPRRVGFRLAITAVAGQVDTPSNMAIDQNFHLSACFSHFYGSAGGAATPFPVLLGLELPNDRPVFNGTAPNHLVTGGIGAQEVGLGAGAFGNEWDWPLEINASGGTTVNLIWHVDNAQNPATAIAGWILCVGWNFR